jgi:hypothetical protein
LTCVSDGNPLRRLLIVSKKRFVDREFMSHGEPPFVEFWAQSLTRWTRRRTGGSASTRRGHDRTIRQLPGENRSGFGNPSDGRQKASEKSFRLRWSKRSTSVVVPQEDSCIALRHTHMDTSWRRTNGSRSRQQRKRRFASVTLVTLRRESCRAARADRSTSTE